MTIGLLSLFGINSFGFKNAEDFKTEISWAFWIQFIALNMSFLASNLFILLIFK